MSKRFYLSRLNGLTVLLPFSTIQRMEGCTTNCFKCSRHLERRLPRSGLERVPACHSERSEESGSPDAQNDRPSLQMSTNVRKQLTLLPSPRIMSTTE